MTVGTAILSAQPSTMRHGSTIEGLDEMADAIVDLTTRRWEGRRTPGPNPTARPSADVRLDSQLYPLSVHGRQNMDIRHIEHVLSVLESAAHYAQDEGWMAPYGDGGLGGTNGFDLYLEPTEKLATAYVDGRLLWGHFDGATAYAVVDSGLRGVELEAAVMSAYIQALTYNLDTAEAESWRRATGTWMAWRMTGAFGVENAVVEQQRESWRSWISKAAGDGNGGALFLTMISERHDEGRGDFIRELWQLARQHTWDGVELRADPDLWQALERALDLAGDRLYSLVEDFAVARYFSGPLRGKNAEFHVLRDLSEHGVVPIHFRISMQQMPHHTAMGPSLEPFGSAYALVDVRGAPPESRLRVWLRGEYGVQWALTASRLDEHGRNLGTLSAPPRRGDRRSYLPVELSPETANVMVSITNLSHRLPDADDMDINARAFRLIFEVVQEGHEPVRE